MLSRDSLDVRSDWACHTCHHTVTADHVTNTGQAARQLMSGLDTSDCHQLEELLYRLGRLLHHTHHLLVQAEYIQNSTVQYSTPSLPGRAAAAGQPGHLPQADQARQGQESPAVSQRPQVTGALIHLIYFIHICILFLESEDFVIFDIYS